MLAQTLIAPLGRPIMGSTLKSRAGGWVADLHCRNQRKCEPLEAAGHGSRWTDAHSDSLDDLPLLRRANGPAMVKGGKAAERRLRAAGMANARVEA